jgi:hypothetical protein
MKEPPMPSRSPVDPASAPIFVVGTGRSGTTLLRCMLSAHPRIYITHEAEFYRIEALYPRRASGRDFLDYYFHTGSFRWLKTDPARVLAGLPDPLPRRNVHLAFTALMREKAAQYGRVRFGDKTPLHSRHVARIFSDYPDARVIYIVRDPRAAVVSLTQMPWAAPSVYTNAIYCELDWRSIKKFDKRVMVVRLEDLIREPKPTMERILAHVGEPWDDAVLDHARNLPDTHDMPPYPWLESATSAPTAPPMPKWNTLTPLEIRMIEDIAKRSMKEAGYERAKLDLPREPGKMDILWAGTREIPSLLQTMYLYWRMGRMVRDVRNFENPALLELFKRVNPAAWARYPGFEMPLPPRLPSELGARLEGGLASAQPATSAPTPR